jgi:hypothetical protein
MTSKLNRIEAAAGFEIKRGDHRSGSNCEVLAVKKMSPLSRLATEQPRDMGC